MPNNFNRNNDPFSHRPQGTQGGPHHRKLKTAKAKDIIRVAQRVGERTVRRSTTDPFTTHVAMEEFMAARRNLAHGELKLKMPRPDFAPRVFPGARTVIGFPEKRLDI